MKYALFLGCQIPVQLPAYERSARAVLGHLGVALVDLPFGCCGYPARHVRHDGFLVLAARNLALAERRGLDVLALCQCCYGSLRHAQHFLARDERLRETVDRALHAEGLRYEGRATVRHLLTVLDEDVGPAAIRARITKPEDGMKVAAHYGCHALRPSDVVELDNPLAPTIFERLVLATGATPVEWPRRLECCGAPLAETNPTLAAHQLRGKVLDARESGADVVCTACTYCQIHLRDRQAEALPAGTPPLPALLYPQLLGRALGLSRRALGM